MSPLPGKSCASCTMCCQALEIEHFNKPMGVLCQHCVKGEGCAIYSQRPEVCQDYLCEWLTDRELTAVYRPDKIGTLFMEDPDSDEYHAVCDPSKPYAWRNPLVFRHLVLVAKTGRTVVAKSGFRAWRIFEDGHSVEWS